MTRIVTNCGTVGCKRSDINAAIVPYSDILQMQSLLSQRGPEPEEDSQEGWIAPLMEGGKRHEAGLQDSDKVTRLMLEESSPEAGPLAP